MTRRNLCTNPACKNNVTGWGGGSTPTQSTGLTGVPRTTGAHYTANGFASGPAGSLSGVVGQSFTVSAYFINNATNFGSKLCYCVFQRSVGGDDFSQTSSIALPLGTTRISVTGVAPANTTGIYLLIDSFNASLGSGVDITCCLLEQAAALDTYFDGDSPGAVWDGANGNSSSTLNDANPGMFMPFFDINA